MKCFLFLQCLLWFHTLTKVMKVSKGTTTTTTAQNAVAAITRVVSITNDYFFETVDAVTFDIDYCCKQNNENNVNDIIEYCIYNSDHSVHVFGFLITSTDIAINANEIDFRENATCITSTINDIDNTNNDIKHITINYKYYISNNILHGVTLGEQQFNVMHFKFVNNEMRVKVKFTFDKAFNVNVNDLVTFNMKYNEHCDVAVGNNSSLVYTCNHVQSFAVINVQMMFPMIISKDVLLSSNNNNTLNVKLLVVQVLIISFFIVIMLCYAVTKENINVYTITPDDQMLNELIYKSNNNNNNNNGNSSNSGSNII